MPGLPSDHGFRATASTILNSRAFEPDVIEAALAHQDDLEVARVGDRVDPIDGQVPKNVADLEMDLRRTYNRATYWDQRVKLMQDWADLVDEFGTT